MNLKLQLSVGVIMALGVGSSMVNTFPVLADNALSGSGAPSGIDPDGVITAPSSSSTGTSYAGVNYTTDLVSAPLSLNYVPNFDFGSHKSNIKLPDLNDKSTWISLNDEKNAGGRKLVVVDGNNNTDWQVGAQFSSPSGETSGSPSGNGKMELYLNPKLTSETDSTSTVSATPKTLIADTPTNYILAQRSHSSANNGVSKDTYAFTFSDNSSDAKNGQSDAKDSQSGLLYVPKGYIHANATYSMDITWTLSTTA